MPLFTKLQLTIPHVERSTNSHNFVQCLHSLRRFILYTSQYSILIRKHYINSYFWILQTTSLELTKIRSWFSLMMHKNTRLEFRNSIPILLVRRDKKQSKFHSRRPAIYITNVIQIRITVSAWRSNKHAGTHAQTSTHKLHIQNICWKLLEESVRWMFEVLCARPSSSCYY